MASYKQVNNTFLNLLFFLILNSVSVDELYVSLEMNMWICFMKTFGLCLVNDWYTVAGVKMDVVLLCCTNQAIYIYTRDMNLYHKLSDKCCPQ